jgi:hypothetical protein
MRKIVHLSLFVILFLLNGQCKDAYQFETVGMDGLLVVDGEISDLPGPYFLSLGLTNNAQVRPDPVIGAFVSITDHLGNTENYIDLGGGKYQLSGTIVSGVPGGSYTLKITLPNGHYYESSQETIPTNTKLNDSAYFEVVNEETLSSEGQTVNNWRVNVFLNSSFGTATSGYFRWSVEEIYSLFPTCPPGAIECPPICYIHQPTSYYNLKVIDRKAFSGSYINGIKLEGRDVDYTFATRHYFNVYQHSMNTGAYNYWSKVQQLVSKRGSIFDAPPYTIAGNVHNQNNRNEMVLGYFEASGNKITRLFIDRGYIHTFVQTCFMYLPDYIPNTYFCWDCTQIEGSSIVEPDWFWH